MDDRHGADRRGFFLRRRIRFAMVLRSADHAHEGRLQAVGLWCRGTARLWHLGHVRHERHDELAQPAVERRGIG